MADYYTNFSVVLPLNKEQQKYALKLVDLVGGYRNDNQQLPPDFPESIRDLVEDWPFEVEPVKEGIWINSQYGGQDTVCALIQHLLQKFEFAASVGFEWSHDCSKPRTDGYGGGAAFITATEIETFTTSGWLEKMSC